MIVLKFKVCSPQSPTLHILAVSDNKTHNMISFYDKKEYDQLDIQKIIDENYEESINLEFKSADALGKSDRIKKEISKDISSFANSDGGIIIYGIKEIDHKADSIDFINGREITKEWLENVIESNIRRRISDLVIYPLRFDNDIEKTIYIIKIPVSIYSPHMAIDNRYYKRFNFKSVPMEEYEVRTLFNRKQATKLEIDKLLVTQQGSTESGGLFNSVDYQIVFQVKNVGNAIEENYKTEIQLPQSIYSAGHPNSNPLNPFYIRRDGDFAVFSIPNKSPIFQNELTTIAITTLRFLPQNYHLATEPGIFLKLFYSNGIVEKHINLGELLLANGRVLSVHDFV